MDMEDRHLAKKTKSISFTNATICLEDMTIEEMKKDSVLISSLDELLKDWDGVQGITLTIRQDVQCGGSEEEDIA